MCGTSRALAIFFRVLHVVDDALRRLEGAADARVLAGPAIAGWSEGDAQRHVAARDDLDERAVTLVEDCGHLEVFELHDRADGPAALVRRRLLEEGRQCLFFLPSDGLADALTAP